MKEVAGEIKGLSRATKTIDYQEQKKKKNYTYMD